MKQFFSFLIILFCFSQVEAQSITEGKVVYQISYPDSSIGELAVAMMPTEATMYFKNDKTRMDMKMGMGMNLIALADNKAKTTIVLMDMLGNKTAMKMNEQEINKESKKAGEYEITKTNETKTIAGYLCKKATVTLKDKNSFNVWYTDEIKVQNSNWNNQFKNIDGFLMEFRMDQSLGISMEMTAKTIVNEKQSDSLFVVPDGYNTMTKDELMKMYGGKGSK